jgi:hypothetical protein
VLIESNRSAYRFLCLRCGRTWPQVFDVRVARNRLGEEWRMFFRDGMAFTSPEMGAVCPYCAGLRVKLLPLPSHPAEAASPFPTTPRRVAGIPADQADAGDAAAAGTS